MTASVLQRPTLRLSIASAAVLLCLVAPAQAETLSGNARVIDGDTLVVAGDRVRLDAIDAPESRQSCSRSGRPWSCGKAATQAMRKLVGRNPVRCEVNRRDRYGRAIAVCFAGGRDLQEELVRQGLALAYRRYSRRYVPAEDAARAARVGIWAGSFVEPWRWRRQQRRR